MALEIKYVSGEKLPGSARHEVSEGAAALAAMTAQATADMLRVLIATQPRIRTTDIISSTVDLSSHLQDSEAAVPAPQVPTEAEALTPAEFDEDFAEGFPEQSLWDNTLAVNPAKNNYEVAAQVARDTEAAARAKQPGITPEQFIAEHFPHLQAKGGDGASLGDSQAMPSARPAYTELGESGIKPLTEEEKRMNRIDELAASSQSEPGPLDNMTPEQIADRIAMADRIATDRRIKEAQANVATALSQPRENA